MNNEVCRVCGSTWQTRSKPILIGHIYDPFNFRRCDGQNEYCPCPMTYLYLPVCHGCEDAHPDHKELLKAFKPKWWFQ